VSPEWCWIGELHQSPLRMWIFVLNGQMEFEASDGERHLIAPGNAMLLEDNVGKGHLNRVIGDEAAVLSVIHLQLVTLVNVPANTWSVSLPGIKSHLISGSLLIAYSSVTTQTTSRECQYSIYPAPEWRPRQHNHALGGSAPTMPVPQVPNPSARQTRLSNE